VKTLCQKLITIDILLSHVKIYKMSILTRLLEHKNLPKKNRENGSFGPEDKTDQYRENRKPFF
jgi:hypothetical protein